MVRSSPRRPGWGRRSGNGQARAQDHRRGRGDGGTGSIDNGDLAGRVGSGPAVAVGSLADVGVVRLHLGAQDFVRFDASNGTGGYTPGTPAPITARSSA